VEEFVDSLDLFIAALGDEAQRLAFKLCNGLRMKGIRSDMDYAGKSLKSQMKRADKLKSNHTLILGDNEIRENRAEFRDMRNGSQVTLGLDRIEESIMTLIKER
jgi:histidyl-tRNA synthetase